MTRLWHGGDAATLTGYPYILGQNENLTSMVQKGKYMDDDDDDTGGEEVECMDTRSVSNRWAYFSQFSV